MSSPVGDSNSPSIALIHIFNTITILGFAFLLVIVVTAWRSPSIYRTSTWYSFMISWMVFDLVHFLLFGRQTGPEPPFGLCLAQASFIYMIPVLASFACAALVLQLYHSISLLLDIGFTPRLEGRLMYILLFAPSIFGTLVFIEALTVCLPVLGIGRMCNLTYSSSQYGLNNPEQVSRSTSGMICRISDGVPSKISAAFVIVALAIAMVIEIVVFLTLYRNWRAFRQSSQAPYPSIVRITLVFLLGVISVVLGVVLSLQESKEHQGTPLANAQANIIVEIMPLSAAIVFGTQKDMLQAWMFWKTWKQPRAADSPTSFVPLFKYQSRWFSVA